MRKIFKIYIRKNQYDVYDIPNKEHAGLNDTPKTWWVYFLPFGAKETENVSIDSAYFVPFCKGINRRPWEISFVQTNTHKIKWDEHRFSNTTRVLMKCNGVEVYSFGSTGTTDGLSFAMAKAQYLTVVLSEHAFNFFEPDTEEGRKIYWYGLPATIKNKSEPGEIAIIPDYNAGISKPEWWAALTERTKKIPERKTALLEYCDDIDLDAAEAMYDDYINWGDALSDQHIGWFRD